MNPNNSPSSNHQNSNPNSQNPNPQFSYPYPYPNPYFPNPQNFNFNSQTPNFQYQFPHSQNSQYTFSYPHNSQYQFPFPPFSNPQFETQQTPTNIQDSPHSQVSPFESTNIIDLNDNGEEAEDVREVVGQWKWNEDKLLISAWLNVSIDPMVGTDQKGEAFWDRIRQYCEEDNHGVIKRGVVAMKKRWQRINEGAQKYGSCYEQAERRIGSGSNLDNIIELAHELHVAKYKKKSNFDKHWSELRRQPKWRTLSTTNSESTKRTKLSNSGAYSSSGNNETPTNENVVESPVRPKGTKAAKRKGKGKAKTVEASDEYEELRSSACRKLSLMEAFNKTRQKEIETRQREIETKQNEMDLQVILADTTTMNDAQRKAHSKLLEKILARS